MTCNVIQSNNTPLFFVLYRYFIITLNTNILIERETNSANDIHSITSGGGGGRSLFGGSGGDRRLRHHNHHQGNGPQALKCPRCESLNTKFCYYNNYNLSQPRYFCKSCRRYWTKGGVLRNVPVGGGCRKKKRSKPKASCRNPKSSNSHNSSSDSDSSLTATTTAANTTATAPLTVADTSSGVNSTKSVPTVLPGNPSLNPPPPDHSSAGNDIFPEIDALKSLIASSSAYLPVEFNVSARVSPFRLHHAGGIADHAVGDDLQVQETSNLGFMDAHTPPAAFSGLPEKMTDGGFCTVDWSGCTDQAFFDLTGTVDQSYWNQTQWDQ